MASLTSTRPSHKRQKLSRPDSNDAHQFHPIPSSDLPAANLSPSLSQPTPQKPTWPLSSLEDLPKGKGPQTHTTALPEVIIPQDLAHLTRKYNIATMSIISSSKIEQKVGSLLKHLSAFSFADLDAKPGLVVLYAKASCACKLVSALEIAKREVGPGGGRLWQYSRVSGGLIEFKEREKGSGKEGGRRLDGKVEREGKGKGRDGEDEEGMEKGDGSESEVAFETYKGKERKKVRAVPNLTVYLSRVPVPELKEKFGQQTNL
ncbi:MAG: hypothetical protein MMC23_000662 [Stictis urceolatum]|nr:hypothetical protein [Stictis urceolata]